MFYFQSPFFSIKLLWGKQEKDSLKKHEKPAYRKLIYEKYIKFAKIVIITADTTTTTYDNK